MAMIKLIRASIPISIIGYIIIRIVIASLQRWPSLTRMIPNVYGTDHKKHNDDDNDDAKNENSNHHKDNKW